MEGYDYALPGAYFVTICVKNRACIFGNIREDGMVYSPLGQIASDTWRKLPLHYQHIGVDEFIVMPNHFHGIVIINDVGAGFKPAPTRSRHNLSEIVRGFKTYSSRRINLARGTTGQPVWQRGFWDRIIRDDKELLRLREYIQLNPIRWLDDEMYLARVEK